MKNKFLIIISFFISYQSLAQELDAPSILYNDIDLLWENFPAISEDGLYYIIIYSEYSCCIDSGNILQQRTVNTGEIIKELVLLPNEAERLEFTTKEKATIFKEVKEVLKGTKYYSLQKIEKYELMQYKDNSELFIKTELENQSYISKKFNLPKSRLHGFCCTGNYDSKENCVVDQSIGDVWLSNKHQLLLIQFGVSHQADGCDDGPYYNVIPLLEE